jgi:hypothetical protein
MYYDEWGHFVISLFNLVRQSHGIIFLVFIN